jgi:hypothetical protein
MEVIELLSEHLCQTLTLHEIVTLCTACKKRPTARMLAFALRNTIPCLVGVPMNHTEPEFYQSIARKYFTTMKTGWEGRQEEIRRAVLQFDGTQMMDKLCLYTSTQQERLFLRDVVVQWKEGRQNAALADEFISALDHGFILMNVFSWNLLLIWRSNPSTKITARKIRD